VARSTRYNNMKMHFFINSSPSFVQHLKEMRLLTPPFQNLIYVIRDDKGLWCKGKPDHAEKQNLSTDADPSPLPPSILPARGFGMTRGCRSMGSGAGRHQILIFLRNTLLPGPASPNRPLPCHPEPPDGGSGKVKGGEGSASIGKDQD